MRSDEDSLRRLARAKGQGPSEANGIDGTAAYQEPQTLKKLVRLSNVRQIVLKYMDEEGNVTLPQAALPAADLPAAEDLRTALTAMSSK